MPTYRNIDIQDQGANWTIDAEWRDRLNDPWQSISVSLPSDLNELPGANQDNYGMTEEALLRVVDAIGVQRGLWEG